MTKKKEVSKTALLKRLRRARSTLAFMKRYFKFQEQAAKTGLISPGVTWQKIYEDVSRACGEWCDNALRESQQKKS